MYIKELEKFSYPIHPWTDIEDIVLRLACVLGITEEKIRPTDLIGEEIPNKFEHIIVVPTQQLLDFRNNMNKRFLLSSPDEDMEKKELSEMVKTAIDECWNGLTHREREILKLHFALDKDYAFSYAEIARVFRVTQEAIRNTVKRAIEKLKDTSLAEMAEVIK